MARKPLAIAVAIALLPVLPAQANWFPLGIASAPPARCGHGLAPGPGNTIVLFGGTTGSADRVFFNDTWILDGTAWRPAFPAVAPSARSGPGMTFDMVRGRVVLFGGCLMSALTLWLDDTWEWDGTAWLLRGASVRPTARGQVAMSYDLAHATTVLFGGVDPVGHGLGDTWEWDGAQWTQRNTATAPTPRYGSAMVFDLARIRMLLFGGAAGIGLYRGDTWEYDGANWQLRNPAHSPSPRALHAMTCDWQRDRVVLFGGSSLSGAWLADTWEWDGVDWLHRSPAVNPAGRYYAAQVFDMARNRSVLFGGSRPSALGDTWEYSTTAPPSVATLAPGCAGSAGIPALATPLPWLGDTLQCAVDHTPIGAPALLALGLSSTTWGTLSLPVSLASFGMPGCALAVSGDATIPMTGAVPACMLTLPPNNAFAGMSLFVQALVVDAAANPAGCVLSSALALRLGAR